jgi:hypothetical protein
LLNAGQKLQIYLIIQGTNDAAVKMEEFDLLKKHFLKLKPDYFRSQSCFGGSHPYSGIELPEHTQELVKVTKEFFL